VVASPRRAWLRRLTLRFLFKRPRVLRGVGRLAWLYQASGCQRLVRSAKLTRLLGRRLHELEQQMPPVRRRFSHQLIAAVESAAPSHTSTAPRKTWHVVVLTGCVQDLLFSEINRATVDVLVANGCEVHTPPVQHCCGSLHAHNGDLETARWLARKQLDAIDPFAFDAIISNAGGCGSHLRHYDRLLDGDPAYAARAAEWSRKVRDIHEWLIEIGFRVPAGGQFAGNVTYHESCHLCHGQKISRQPRDVLRAIAPGGLVETAEPTWCCGSAGVYSLTQPDTADWLLHRKVANLQKTGAAVVATANPGCHLQIEKGLAAAGVNVRVVHPVVLLAEAYRRESPENSTANGRE
jgi:glycolate oxidase iron-sulfur subunit